MVRKIADLLQVSNESYIRTRDKVENEEGIQEEIVQEESRS